MPYRSVLFLLRKKNPDWIYDSDPPSTVYFLIAHGTAQGPLVDGKALVDPSVYGNDTILLEIREAHIIRIQDIGERIFLERPSVTELNPAKGLLQSLVRQLCGILVLIHRRCLFHKILMCTDTQSYKVEYL